MSNFEERLSQHLATAYWKQIQLTEFLDEHHWEVDLATGTAAFGAGRVYPIQIVGTESEITSTWLWGWANPGGNIPPELLQCSEKLRCLGAAENIAELTQDELSLDEIDGHMLAMLASGVCQASAYYRGPYDGGAVYFLLNNVPLPKSPASPMQAIRVLSAVIAQFPVSHRVAAVSFLQQQGYSVTEHEEAVEGLLNGEKVRLTFDHLGRIVDMGTALNAPVGQQNQINNENVERKSWWRFGR